MATTNGQTRITDIDTDEDCYCGNCGMDYTDLTIDGLRRIVAERECPACSDYLDSIAHDDTEAE
jgi:hypothetical protein